jgi:hypothetical protein
MSLSRRKSGTVRNATPSAKLKSHQDLMAFAWASALRALFPCKVAILLAFRSVLLQYRLEALSKGMKAVIRPVLEREARQFQLSACCWPANSLRGACRLGRGRLPGFVSRVLLH